MLPQRATHQKIRVINISDAKEKKGPVWYTKQALISHALSTVADVFEEVDLEIGFAGNRIF